MAAPVPLTGVWYNKPLITSDRYPDTNAKSYIGATLTCSAGDWAANALPFTDAYQWKQNGADVVGATTNTLVLADADFDVGDIIRCDVTRTNGDGSATHQGLDLTIITSVLVRTVLGNIAPSPGGPIISGTLYGSPGTWEGWPAPTFAYQWRLNGADISGATTINRSLATHAIGDSLVLRVTATNSEGSVSADSAATIVVPDFDVPVPGVRLPVTKALAVNEVWDITMLGDVQLFVDGATAGYTRPGTNTKSIRFKAAGTYTLSTSSPLEKCVVTVT